MSTYPGEDPSQPADQQPEGQQPEGQQPETDAEVGTEPTQPVGYWERQAAEQARAQGPTGWEQGTTRPYEQHPYGQPGHGQPPYPPPVQSYGQPQYTQPQYTQPPYGQQQYGQPSAYGYPPAGGYGQPSGGHPGYPPYSTFNPAAPNHSQATTALVLGIIGLAGGLVLCGVGLLASPFAWALGRNALKEIQTSQGRLGGEGSARAGMIMGIIGTILLVLAVIGLILFAVVLAVSDTTSGSSI